MSPGTRQRVADAVGLAVILLALLDLLRPALLPLPTIAAGGVRPVTEAQSRPEADSISRTMVVAAARGSSAAVMGRPTTR